MYVVMGNVRDWKGELFRMKEKKRTKIVTKYVENCGNQSLFTTNIVQSRQIA
jgi:hypothetical protein